jgi:hypothetical protein
VAHRRTIVAAIARQRALLLALAGTLAACADQAPPVPVASVELTAPVNALLIGPGGGQSVQLSATPRAAGGTALERRPITWSVQPAGIVSVSPTGLVTALGVGSASVRATVSNVTASVAIGVQPVPIASVEITSGPLALTRTPLTGDSIQVAGIAYDSTGAVLPDRTPGWVSSNSLVATVSPSGLVRAVGTGSAFVIAVGAAGRDSVSVDVTFDATLPDGFDVAVTGARWTQTAQYPDGRIPMLLGGRAAVVHAVVTASGPMATATDFELRLLAGDGSVTWHATKRAVPEPGVGSFDSPTLEFLVPATALAAGLRWELRWTPEGDLVDADPATDRWPREGPVALNAVQPPPLSVRFVPITLTANGGATGNVSEANVEEYLRLIRQFGPVGSVDYTLAAPFEFSLAWDGTASWWISLLQQVDAARVASPDHAQAHWAAVVQPPPGVIFSPFGGFGYVPSNGASFGPGTRTFALVNIGWFNLASQTRELMMHELGHNLGSEHAPCGGAGFPDPAYPIAGGLVGTGVHDTYSFERGFSARAVPIPPNFGDTMGYCTPVWISPYSYDKMLRFRGVASLSARDQEPAQRALLVYGVAHDAGRAVLDRVLRVETISSVAEDQGDWEAAALDAEGNTLTRRRFRLTRVSHVADAQAIVVALPVTDVDL